MEAYQHDESKIAISKIDRKSLQKKKADQSQIKKTGTDSLASTEITSVGITLRKIFSCQDNLGTGDYRQRNTLLHNT